MASKSANLYIEGTSALDMNRSNALGRPLEVVRSSARQKAGGSWRAHARSRGGFRAVLNRILDSSEMHCSLRYESMSGCPYGLFTKGGIAALSSSSALIGIVSLALGA